MKWVFKHQELQMLRLKSLQIGVIFSHSEVVGRGSGTQPQVGENLIF